MREVAPNLIDKTNIPPHSPGPDNFTLAITLCSVPAKPLCVSRWVQNGIPAVTSLRWSARTRRSRFPAKQMGTEQVFDKGSVKGCLEPTEGPSLLSLFSSSTFLVCPARIWYLLRERISSRDVWHHLCANATSCYGGWWKTEGTGWEWPLHNDVGGEVIEDGTHVENLGLEGVPQRRLETWFSHWL